MAMGTRERCDIAVHYRVYDAAEVPFEDDEALRDWMYARYKEKDDMLGRYYETGEFFRGETGQRVVFSWTKIIIQYIFWFGSCYLHWKLYTWLLMLPYYFLFPRQ
ncbi:unnamed protein product, partial [Mesorhabditis belari]